MDMPKTLVCRARLDLETLPISADEAREIALAAMKSDTLNCTIGVRTVWLLCRAVIQAHDAGAWLNSINFHKWLEDKQEVEK